MRIGVPSEIKPQEKRVGLTPESVAALTSDGHEVIVQAGAGSGIGAEDKAYAAAGATIEVSRDNIFASSDMIVKVKEPQAEEIALLRSDQLLFTYLHLAPDRPQTEGLLASGCTAIAYETITDKNGALPLLRPMSQVAGRMAVHVAATTLQHTNGGQGLLIGGVPGVGPAKVLILGGGVSGRHAAQMAVGMGADVTVFDLNVATLEQLDIQFGASLKTQFSTRAALSAALKTADVVIGAVLVAGAKAPKLVTAHDLKTMKAGSVLVDIAIDQGGCFETSKATTHESPTYVVDDVVHYCVANMPGGVPKTSTYALNAATLPFARALANKGWRQACAEDQHLALGLNIHAGKIEHPEVAHAFPELPNSL